MKSIYIILIIIISLELLRAEELRENPYFSVTAAGVTLNYRVTPDQLNLDCQLIANTTGWVAVGFAPVQAMQGANFIIGYHQNGNTFIRDDWGNSTTSHVSDTSLGGTNNIISSSSSETGGVTQLNFVIPLNSGDSFDRVLAVGQTYPVILGRGPNGSDNFTTYHAAVGSAQITLQQPVSVIDENLVAPPGLGIRIFPNPFTSELSIAPETKSNSTVKIEVYNQKGQLVAKLSADKGSPIRWNSINAAPGVYFIKAADGNDSTTRKVLKIK